MEIASFVLAAVLVISVPIGMAAPLRLPLAERWWAGFLALLVPLVVLHALGVSRTASLSLMLTLFIASIVYGARTRAPQGGRTERALLAFYWIIAALVAAGALHAFVHPVIEWDAAAVWWPKARDLAGWRPLADTTRPAYPELGAMAWSLVTLAAGGLESAGRVVFPVAATMALLALARLAPRPLTAAGAIVLGTLAVIFYGIDSFTNGYQDALLAAGAGISAIALAESLPLASASRIHIWRGLGTAGALGLIKSEGALVGAVIALTFLAVAIATAPRSARGDAMRALAGPAVIFAALTLLWPVLLLANHISAIDLQEGSFSLSGVLSMPARLGRLPEIARAMLSLAGHPVRAVVLLVIGVLGVVAIVSQRRHWTSQVRLRLIVLALIAATHVMVVVGIFLATNVPLAWHLDTALARLLLHVRFVVAAFAAIVASQLIASVQERTATHE